MRRSYARTFALLVAVAASACSDTTGSGDTPPVLPAPESMEFDLSFFTDVNPVPTVAPAAPPGANWFHAAASVAVANLAVAIHTVVPLATWRAAIAQHPVREDDGWHWRFSTQAGNDTYSGDLRGYVDDGDLIAEMRITASALGLDDFLWYVGTAPVGGTTGTWEFYDPESPSTVVGAIEWSHPGTLVWTVSFVAVAGENAGDELTYEIDGTARAVRFYDASEGTEVVIEWDAQTYAGSITAPGYNGGQRACWDGMLADVACAG